MQKIPRSFGTHDGTFHADEVSACALMLLFNLIDEDKIFRSRDLAILNRCEYVCDVGGIFNPEKKLFDHHQVDYKGSLSGAGMILQYLRDQQVIDPLLYEYFNQSLILGVDAHDNGRDPQAVGFCSFSNVISNFTPISHEVDEETQNVAFREALKFALGHLDRLLKRFHYIQSCRQAVVEAMKPSNECLMFDKALPWMDIFFQLEGVKHPALFVVMPSGKHWKLRGIPPNYQDKMKVRMSLPEEWAGLIGDELKRVTGIEGAIFCHKGKFISVWETKEDAMKALEYTLTHSKGSGR